MGRVSRKKRDRELSQKLESVIAEQAFEDAHGGPMHSRQNDELFVVDKETDVNTYKTVRDSAPGTASLDILNNTNSNSKSTNNSSSSNSYFEIKIKSNTPLYWDKVLEPVAGMPALTTPKTRFAQKQSQKYIKKVEELSKKKFVVTKAIKKASTSSATKSKKSANVPLSDVWNEDDGSTKLPPNLLPIVAPAPPKRKIKGKRADPEVSRRVPAVQIPDSGYSYNPTYEAHQDLLGRAVAMELKQQERVNSFRKKMVPERNADSIQGIFVNVNHDNNDTDDTDKKDKVVVVKKTKAEKRVEKRTEKMRREGMRLTTAQRHRQRKAHLLLRRAQWSKFHRMQMKQVNNLSTLVIEIKRQEAVLARKQKARERRTEAKKLLPPFKGKYRFEADAYVTDVPLSEDLSGNLRTVKPQGSLLRDQFINYHRRALIAPHAKDTKPIVRRKYALKTYTKHGVSPDIARINLHSDDKKHSTNTKINRRTKSRGRHN